jgi:hypothetical protein
MNKNMFAFYTIFLIQSHGGFSLDDTLKGQSHEIFDLCFFSSNCTPGSPDSWAKTVLHIL